MGEVLSTTHIIVQSIGQKVRDMEWSVGESRFSCDSLCTLMIKQMFPVLDTSSYVFIVAFTSSYVQEERFLHLYIHLREW